ncbi:hypothetical protein HHK36_000659 [Tetracentron sinense]|uniref:Uncharacterized protein n=1 Tax=Tetracentron sinense TaxID=13715 RepID=A0A834ZSK6_TETSI|nr:hypothetical protein HHK36_000659 [Tetracentron sinense]
MGNPMGFARNVRIDIKDFLSVTAWGILQNPERRLFFSIYTEGAIKVILWDLQGMLGSTSKISDQLLPRALAKMEIQQKGIASHSNGVLNEFLKEFGSAGVIGNLMRSTRNVGLDIKDFLSVPAKSILQKPERRLFFSIHSEGAIKVLSYGAQHHRFELPSSECYEGYMFSWL